MAKYKGIITTDAGLESLAKACSGGSVKFTAVKTGDGAYDGTEDLFGMTALKSEKQSFGVSGITRTGMQVKVRSVLSNEGLTTGYNITEVGLFAMDPDTGSEFLYAIIVAETGREDYLPPYEDSPSSITMEIYLILTETENDVTFTAEIVAGTYVSAEDFHDHVLNEGHITSDERKTWNAKAEEVTNIIDGTQKVGDAKQLDGHEAEYFLPKSGGTIEAAGAQPLKVKNTVSNLCFIPFIGIDGELGYLGFDGANPCVILQNEEIKKLLHSGNIGDYALPLTGGNITGNVAIDAILAVGNVTKEAKYQMLLRNAKRNLSSEIDANGNYAFWDSTHSDYIFQSTKEGKNTFHGVASECLPLTGGMASEQIGVEKADATEAKVVARNALGAIELIVSAGGRMGLYDRKNGAWLCDIMPNGTATFNGTATENLPLTGGTISNKLDTPLVLNNATGDAVSSFLGYKADGVTLGYIGFKNGFPYVTYPDNFGYIIHTGNYKNYAADVENGTFDLTIDGVTLSGYKYVKIGKFVYLYGSASHSRETAITIATPTSVTGFPFPFSSGVMSYLYFGGAGNYTLNHYKIEGNLVYSTTANGFTAVSATTQIQKGVAMYLHAMYITN